MVREPVVGERAPDFELPEAYGGTVRLSEVLASGNALLAFYPSDWGIMCSVEMKALQQLLRHFREIGTEIVGISTNSVFCHSAWKMHMDFTFPLLADFDGRVSESYGVLVGEEGYMKGRCMRAVILVDRGQTIRYWWWTEDNATEPDYDQLFEACSKLKSDQ